MSTDSTAPPGRLVGAMSILTVLVGVLVFGYGLLLVPQSVLGGAWVAAIGLSLVLSGAFDTEWVGDRFDLSPAGRHRLSLAFAVVAVVLLLLFAVVNG